MKPRTTTRRPRPGPLSARRRVGAQSSNKITKSDLPDPQASNRPERVLLWPEAIAKNDRLPLLAGHRSFVTAYQVSSTEMKRGQKVRIQGHALACSDDSRLLIERDDGRYLIEPGQKVLLSDTTVTLSELPSGKSSPGIFYYWFFGDEVLADIVSMHPRASSHLFLAAQYPSADGIIPMRHTVSPTLNTLNAGARDMLQPILTWLFNQPTLPLWKLCVHRVTIPRLRIQIFLENLVLRSSEEHDAILKKFPGGKTALLREMRHLKMPSIAAMVDQRRFELCFAWHTYGGKTFEDIEKALKVSRSRRFRARYGRWVAKTKPFTFSDLRPETYEGTLLAANCFLPSLRGQYWHRRQQQEVREQEVEVKCLIDHEVKAQAFEPPIQIPPSPVPLEIVSSFWEMKSTGVEILIGAEQFTLVPGLEDCCELLLAA